MSFSRRTMAAATVLMAAVLGVIGGPSSSPAQAPMAHAAATCSDFPNQAAAQKAHNTWDANYVPSPGVSTAMT